MVERRPGVWTLRVRAGRDPATGKSRIVNETFKGGGRAAARRLAQLVAEHGGRTSTRATLRRVLAEWRAHANHQPRTVVFYDAALAHVPAALLDTPAADLTAADLDRTYRELQRAGLGVPTVRAVHAMLAAGLRQAVRWGWLSRNVARDASPPRPRRRQAAALPADALDRLLAATNDRQWRLWLLLAATTAARRGEVLALRWADVDTDARTVTIGAGLGLDNRRAPTKTAAGQRAVHIGADLVAELKAWRVAQLERALAAGVPLAAEPYVLSDAVDSGQPWRLNTATTRFKRLARDAGLPEWVRLHDLRHNAASRLIAAGHDVVTVAQRLGHSSPRVTLDVYAHAVDAAARAAGDDIERLLRGTK